MRTFMSAASIGALACGLLGASAASTQTAPEAVPPVAAPPKGEAKAPDASEDPSAGDIVVTARRRAEGLMNVPVAVSALSGTDLSRNNATDLSKIGELTPSVIVANYKSNSGGSIAVRGISSSANQFGFEQDVSVSIDGVQLSNGRLSGLGFFDLAQVEVLKGPQALLFGKNSPAGVISVQSAEPTDRFEARIAQTYEFVGDEAITEGYVSGPITSTLKARVALRYRNLQGWLYNDARAIANPFYTAAQPAGAAILPGASDRRVGDSDVLGRISLLFEPTSNFTASLKVFGAHGDDQGNGSSVQNIGPCTGPNGRAYGFVDPFDNCRADNRVSVGSLPAAVSVTSPRGTRDGRSRGDLDAIFANLNLNWKLGWGSITSTTGFSNIKATSNSGIDYTVFDALYVIEDAKNRAFSQELRLLTDFNSRVNFMVGGYFQSTRDVSYNDALFRADLGYSPALNRYSGYEKVGTLKGQTLSAFAQGIWKFADGFELAGGARFTHERKTVDLRNIFGVNSAVGAFDTSKTIFATSTNKIPGLLAGEFTDNNVSPEATLTWHPRPNTTLYVAYKTGFKSGGFGVSSPLATSTTISDIDFKSEKARGGEIGAKGEFLNNRLRVTASAFLFDFTNLQVNSYDATAIRYQIDNAGAVRQRGIDFDLNYRPARGLTFRAAVAYVHNRFKDYVGQCYGYAIPAGQALTAAAPPNCSFVLNANGTRFLAANGTPILQQVFSGRAPARSPDFSGSTGATYESSITDGLKLRVSGDAFYTSGYYASETMASSTFQKAFWRFNASIGLSSTDDRWTLSLIGRNLSNKYYLAYAADRTGGTSIPLTVGEQRGVVARGREFALQAANKF